jgi:hypothetical protein
MTTVDPQYPAAPVVDGRPVVDPKQTLLVDLELAAGTQTIYRQIFGEDLTLRATACFCAQMILETGRTFCYWWNITNIKASLSYRGMVQYYNCSEIIAGVEKHFLPYNPVACFRAWDTLGKGIEQHLRFLGTVTNSAGHPNRYQAAFDAAVRGDVVGMVDELARAGFFTANVSLYQSGMQRIFNQLLATLPGVLPTVVHQTVPELHQPTSGRSPFTDADLKRVYALQLPLTVDWHEWQEDVRQQLLNEDLPQ